MKKNLNQLSKSLKNNNKGLITILLSENDNVISIDMIEVDSKARKQGVGSKVMKDIIKHADETNKEIVLLPAISDDRKGTTSRSRLVKFYKRFGFVENKGRNKDFSKKGGSMYRLPNPKKFFKGGEVGNYNKWKNIDWNSYYSGQERSRIFRVLNWANDGRIDYSKLSEDSRVKLLEFIEGKYLSEMLEYIMDDEFSSMFSKYVRLTREESVGNDKSLIKMLNTDKYKDLRDEMSKYDISIDDMENKKTHVLTREYVESLSEKEIIDIFILDDFMWGEFGYRSKYDSIIDLSKIYYELLETGAVFTEEEEAQQYDLFEVKQDVLNAKSELSLEIDKEVLILNEYLLEAIEDGEKNIISELEGRISFLNELRDDEINDLSVDNKNISNPLRYDVDLQFDEEVGGVYFYYYKDNQILFSPKSIKRDTDEEFFVDEILFKNLVLAKKYIDNK